MNGSGWGFALTRPRPRPTGPRKASEPMARKPKPAKTDAEALDQSECVRVAESIRAFLRFVDTLDKDSAGNSVCPESRPTLETKWGDVCESVNVVRRKLLLRLPRHLDHCLRPEEMSAGDRELFDTLSNALWSSALTRYMPEGTPWLEAVARSAEIPPVGLRVVEADRVRKLRAIADKLHSARADDAEYRPATWFRKGMAARLRMAAQKGRKTKRVATRKIDGVVCYSVADARGWWAADVPDDRK